MFGVDDEIFQKFNNGDYDRYKYNKETCGGEFSSVNPTFYQTLDFDEDCNSMLEIKLNHYYYQIDALYVWIAVAAIPVILFLILRRCCCNNSNTNNNNDNNTNRQCGCFYSEGTQDGTQIRRMEIASSQRGRTVNESQSLITLPEGAKTQSSMSKM